MLILGAVAAGVETCTFAFLELQAEGGNGGSKFSDSREYNVRWAHHVAIIVNESGSPTVPSNPRIQLTHLWVDGNAEAGCCRRITLLHSLFRCKVSVGGAGHGQHNA